MCIDGTRVSDERAEWGLWVKHEEECCPGGPHFSKCRGVYAHVAARSERFIGVLDTSHSQGGFAVARACQLLGKKCIEFYPVRKGGLPSGGAVQQAVRDLGGQTMPLVAGRSAVLYHYAKRWLRENEDVPAGDVYMMPNALKLPEMVTETAAEVQRTASLPFVENFRTVKVVLVSASSGTIAAGVARGLFELGWEGRVVVHLGYSRPLGAMRAYMKEMADWQRVEVEFVDENYSYADSARPGPTPPWSCNEHYDLKAFRWWAAKGRALHGEALLWNIG
jgi:threonine dehydratase